MRAGDIDEQFVQERGLDAPEKDTMDHITQRVRAVLARMAPRLTREQAGQLVLWSARKGGGSVRIGPGDFGFYFGL